MSWPTLRPRLTLPPFDLCLQTPELKTMVDEELSSRGRRAAGLAMGLQMLGVCFGATALYLITRWVLSNFCPTLKYSS